MFEKLNVNYISCIYPRKHLRTLYKCRKWSEENPETTATHATPVTITTMTIMKMCLRHDHQGLALTKHTWWLYQLQWQQHCNNLVNSNTNQPPPLLSSSTFMSPLRKNQFPTFDENPDPVVGQNWLKNIESQLQALEVPKWLKVDVVMPFLKKNHQIVWDSFTSHVSSWTNHETTVSRSILETAKVERAWKLFSNFRHVNSGIHFKIQPYWDLYSNYHDKWYLEVTMLKERVDQSNQSTLTVTNLQALQIILEQPVELKLILKDVRMRTKTNNSSLANPPKVDKISSGPIYQVSHPKILPQPTRKESHVLLATYDMMENVTRSLEHALILESWNTGSLDVLTPRIREPDQTLVLLEEF